MADLGLQININNIEMDKVDYSKYLDSSGFDFELPIRADNYDATYDNPFNFAKTYSEGVLSIDIDLLVSMVDKDIKDSGLDDYTFYNFRDFFNELLDINMLDSYEYDSEDLEALYSCVMENIKDDKK